MFGVDDEQFGQRLKAVVVTRDGKDLSADEVKQLRQGEPRRLQGPARRRVRRRAAAHVDRQGAQAGAPRRLIRVVCWSHASAHGRLRSRAPGAHLGRGPPARPARRASSRSRSAASPTRADAGRRAGAARRLPHDRQRLGAAAALRRSRSSGPCMRCLEPAAPRFEVDAREVEQPGAGDEELSSPYVDDDGELDLAGVGARRARAHAAGPDHVPARLRGPVRAVRGEPQRGPEHAHEARRTALGEAVGDPLRLGASDVTPHERAARATKPCRSTHDPAVRSTRPRAASTGARLRYPSRRPWPSRSRSSRTAHEQAPRRRTRSPRRAVNACPQCRQPRRPHRVCPNCGFYGGREVVHVHDHDHDHEH